MDQFSRTELLFGKEAMNKLANSKVIVFGVGGVGGYVVEALARSGVGAIDVVDNDKICLSNINRQIIATTENVGNYKVDEIKKRILSINPECKVKAHKLFYMPENADNFDFSQYDYVVDAIDTVKAKLQLALQAQNAFVKIISSMGAGNKVNPVGFKVGDLYKTSVDPLAKVMRREGKKLGIKKLKVVYSEEEALTPSGNVISDNDTGFKRRTTPGSTAFVPSVVGLIIASEVVKDLIGFANER